MPVNASVRALSRKVIYNFITYCLRYMSERRFSFRVTLFVHLPLGMSKRPAQASSRSAKYSIRSSGRRV